MQGGRESLPDESNHSQRIAGKVEDRRLVSFPVSEAKEAKTLERNREYFLSAAFHLSCSQVRINGGNGPGD